MNKPISLPSDAQWLSFEFGLNLTADFTLRFLWVSLLFITIHYCTSKSACILRTQSQIEIVIVGKVIYGGDNGW